jgi:hypothetical protein
MEKKRVGLKKTLKRKKKKRRGRKANSKNKKKSNFGTPIKSTLVQFPFVISTMAHLPRT